MITVTDLFCGAGGSGLGATAVPGVELVMAANHSPRAIETHSANFPGCEHDCADISQVDPRRYSRTTILWASPECTNHSIAKGRKRGPAQPDLFGETVPDHVAERSRATMWDVPRFAEHHRYDVVIVENVVDAAKWTPFPAWLMAMESLGYRHRVVSLNSMHAPAIAAPRAPQSRDRMYVVFWRKGNPAPELDVRPAAWCPDCGCEVRAVQSFKPGAKVGRFRQQYVYRCPNVACRNTIVEPYAAAAATAIDWTVPGQRIADRDRPLSAKTLARIRAGLERFVTPQLVTAGGSWNDTAYPVTAPFRTRTTREAEGLVVPLEGREGKEARSVCEPFRTQTTRHQDALVVPYFGTATTAQSAGRPLGTLTTHDRYGLAFIAELRGGGSTARQVREPLATVCASGNHHMLVEAAPPPATPPQVEDCQFRMLTVGEIQAAMAFAPGYVITGTKREQVRQLGNGVTPPAAEWLVTAAVNSLTATHARKEAA